MGGYYATLVAGQARLQVVLLNPAVSRRATWRAHINEQTSWRGPARTLSSSAPIGGPELLALDVSRSCPPPAHRPGSSPRATSCWTGADGGALPRRSRSCWRWRPCAEQLPALAEVCRRRTGPVDLKS